MGPQGGHLDTFFLDPGENAQKRANVDQVDFTFFPHSHDIGSTWPSASSQEFER